MEPGGAEQHGWIGRLTRFITGHPWTVTVLALAVAATCIWLTFQLRVNQQLRALLPSGSASVSRLLAMEARQGNQSDLYVVIRSPDRDRNIRFGEGIAEHLRQREDIRFVVFHQDYSFFEDRALLFMEMEDLEDLRERVKRRIQAEVRDELMGELEDRGRASGEEAEPLPDEDSLKEEYGLDDTLKEYFEADEGRLLVVKARPTGSTQDMEYSRHLVREVDAAVAALDPASFHPEMEVTLEGSFAENARRVRTMESNVLSGTSVTLAILFVSLLLFLRSVLMVTLSFLPLLVSTFAALAAGRLVFRELNLISAFIFAVLLGLGIDFSIHFLSRYREERAAGLGVTEACSRCLATSGVAMFFGALSTSASFLILVGSDFQGFVQFGLVGAVGVMLAIGTVFLVMPALLALIGRTRFAPPRPLPPIRNRTIPVWLAILLLVLAVGAAVAGVVVAPDLTFETNLNALGSNEDQPEDTGDRISYREAVGKATTTAPAIILTRDLEETRRVHRVLDAVVKLAEADEAREEEAPQPTAPAAPVPEGDPLEDFGDAAPAAPVPDGDPLEDFGDAAPAAPGPDGDPLEDFGDSGATPPRPAPEPIPLPEDPEHLQIMKDRLARVFSVFTFVPERQDEKLAVIADIKHRIDRKRGALTVETRETIDKWYRYLEVTEPFGVEALPAWVTQQFVDLEGDMGRFVIYWTKGPKADYRNSKVIYDHFFDLDIGGGDTARSAASFFVLPEIIDIIRDEGPGILGLVFLCLTVATALLLRRAVGVLMVLAGVVVPLLWLLVVMRITGWSFNFYNVIAFPLLIGMGEDNSLHIHHRYLEEGRGSLWRVVRETGGAVFMAAWTTIVGYASLLFGHHKGLLTLAELSITGIALCWLSSVVLMPSMLRVREWLQERREARRC